MRLLWIAVPVLAWASPAVAADVSGDIGVVSDYRYRGVTLSRGHPAVQASLTLEHDSGLYASVWGSTLGHEEEIEADFTAGYSKDLSEAFNIDLSGSYFTYPTGGDEDYFEATAIATMTKGSASASLGFSYIPPQRATRDDEGDATGNGYLFGSVEYQLPKSPVTVRVGLGYERGAFDEVEHGKKFDWNIGAEMKLKPVRISVTYVGSNADRGAGDHHAIVASAFAEW